MQALNSLILGARPFWPQGFCQKYDTKAVVQGHQGHTKYTGFVSLFDSHLNTIWSLSTHSGDINRKISYVLTPIS